MPQRVLREFGREFVDVKVKLTMRPALAPLVEAA
jgi:hypothetical protein